MSALAMILTAAMVIPGDDPQKVSDEVAESQPLDLSGEWEATLHYNGETFYGKACIGNIAPFGPTPTAEGLLVTYRGAKESGSFIWGSVPVDEGYGRFRIGRHLGIYRYEGKYLHLCFREARDRPTAFCAANAQAYLILHRVKHRK